MTARADPAGVMHVAWAGDRAYVPHAAAALRSLTGHASGERIHAHFLHPSGTDTRCLEGLRSIAAGGPLTVELHAISPAQVTGLPGWGRIPPTMWYRILLPELLPGVERVLYLDCDVLVLTSISPLWALDLTDSYLAAVTNVPEQHMLGHARELGLAGPERYFNSGVLLMNLELMRRDGCAAALRECALDRSGHLLWPDQDALNLVLGERRHALHPRWNLMNSIRSFPWSADLFAPGAVAEAIRDPAIIHFEGPRQNKPWHVLCDHPYRDAYLAHRRQTPWPRVRRDGVTPANMVRALRRRRTAVTP